MNHIWNLSLYQIQVFVKAAEFKSFSLAAIDLNTTQSSISKSIASTEAIVGFPLFVRSRRGLELTRPGERLLEKWKTLLFSVETAYTSVATEFSTGSSALRIAIPDSLEPEFVTGIVDRFLENTPMVKVVYHSLPSGDIPRALHNNDVELAITGSFDRDRLEAVGCTGTVFVQTPRTVFMHKSNPLAAKEHLSVKDLEREQFYMLSPTVDTSYSQEINLLCGKHGFSPHVMHYVPSFLSMGLSLKQNRSGVFLSNRYNYFAHDPDLRCLDLEGTSVGLLVAWNPKIAPPQLHSLVDFFIECLQTNN